MSDQLLKDNRIEQTLTNAWIAQFVYCEVSRGDLNTPWKFFSESSDYEDFENCPIEGKAPEIVVNEAASLLGKRSAEARRKKWGKEEFVKKMREWGKLGGRPRKGADNA